VKKCLSAPRQIDVRFTPFEPSNRSTRAAAGDERRETNRRFVMRTACRRMARLRRATDASSMSVSVSTATVRVLTTWSSGIPTPSDDGRAARGGSRGSSRRRSVSTAIPLSVDGDDEERSRAGSMIEAQGARKRARDAVVVMHPDTSRGIEVLHNPVYNKGTSFTASERERLGVRGLVPPRYFTIEEQSKKIWAQNKALAEPLDRWSHLQDLKDRNETLFYRLVKDNIEELAPIIYTPTVGDACLKYSALLRRARGMYFSCADRGDFNSMMFNWKRDVSVIVVTDGSRILGLGDLGTNGMGISQGKLDLYVAGGGFDPQNVLPVVLDVGTNNPDILNDPYYIGAPHKRIEGKEYDDFIDEFIRGVQNRWPNALIQFEDFQTKHANNILQRYRDKVLCFNDDIQGTAAIVLAGIYGAMKCLTGHRHDIVNQTFVMCGAGSAGMGIAAFLHQAMMANGLSAEEAYKRFYVIDKDGLITHERSLDEAGSEPIKPFAANRSDLPDGTKLIDVIKKAKPTVLLGVSTVKGLFDEDVLKTMGEINERPIIMPLSNPTSRAECTAEEAARATQGRAIFSSGSPFKDVELEGRFMKANQGNNFYVFPGLGLGALLSKSTTISDGMLQAAARAIPAMLTEDQYKAGIIYPHIDRIRDISAYVAIKVMQEATKEGRVPEDVRKLVAQGEKAIGDFVFSTMYVPSYRPTVFSCASRKV